MYTSQILNIMFMFEIFLSKKTLIGQLQLLKNRFLRKPEISYHVCNVVVSLESQYI